MRRGSGCDSVLERVAVDVNTAAGAEGRASDGNFGFVFEVSDQGAHVTDRSSTPWRIAETVQERVNAGESVRDLAASAFMSEDEFHRDYLSPQ